MEPQATSLLIDPVVLLVETLNLFLSKYSGLRERTNPPPSKFLLWLAIVTNKDVNCVPWEYSEKEKVEDFCQEPTNIEGNLRAS